MASGETVEYMGKGGDVVPLRIAAMHNERCEPLSRANPGERIVLTTDPPLESAEVNGILRRTR